MIRLLKDWIPGWDDADDQKREHMMRGIMVRKDGSAYWSDERILEVVTDYLKSRSSPSDAGKAGREA